MISPKIAPFETDTARYEKWFEVHKNVYLSELNAIRAILPEYSRGLEVGVGTGRFSHPFGIRNGIDPSRNALNLARKRGIEVVAGVGEALPYARKSFDLALIVTTICFFSDVSAALKEVFSVLRPTGSLVIGYVDKYSTLGREYQEKRSGSPFYRSATFIGTSELSQSLLAAGFDDLVFVQTVFKRLEEIKEVEPVKQGFGEGSFVAVRAKKPG